MHVNAGIVFIHSFFGRSYYYYYYYYYTITI